MEGLGLRIMSLPVPETFRQSVLMLKGGVSRMKHPTLTFTGISDENGFP